MIRIRRSALGAMASCALSAVPACSCGDPAAGADAAPGGDASLVMDAAVGADAVAPLIWIDFAIIGCEAQRPPGGGRETDAGPPPGMPTDDAGPGNQPICLGAAPLRAQLVALAPAEVELYEWSFGDGSEPDRRASPDHVFSEPGVYDVSLFAQGPGGTAAITRPSAVQVGPSGLGAACSADAQCGTGRCTCEGGACEGLATGFCSTSCSAEEPCPTGVCVDLAPGSPPDPEEWQASLCLPACGDDSCEDHLACAELRRGDSDGWSDACFVPGLVGRIGDSCAGPDGELEGAGCASGVCLAEGLRGLCSASCAGGRDCPASAACAVFEGGGGAPDPSCVARCDADTACDADPWLACEAPGGEGPRSFTVDEPPAEDGYCAPRSCETPDDCPLGDCVEGHCAP